MPIQSASDLFSPVQVEQFIDSYLERKVLHLERNDARQVEGLFDLDDLERCLRFVQPWHRGAVRVVSGGGREDPAQLDRVGVDGGEAEQFLIQRFASKKTIVLQSAHEYWPPIAGIVLSLRRALKSHVRCNVYCTPPDSQGLGTHTDNHDVVILQTYGSKAWRIQEVDHALPIESGEAAGLMHPRLSPAKLDEGSCPREMVLYPGDVLHSAATTEESSIHLTIGLYPLRRHELMRQLVDLLAMEDEGLRRRVSPAVCSGKERLPNAGEMFRELARIADELEPPLDLAPLIFLNSQLYTENAEPGGAILSRLGFERINLSNKLEIAAGATLVWCDVGTELRVRVGSASMSLPSKLAPVLPFFEKNRSFLVAGLPSRMTDNAKVVLSRSMVKNGLLRIVSLGECDGSSSRSDGYQ